MRRGDLFDFSEKVADVEPLDAAVVEQLGRTEVDRLAARLLVLAEQVVEDGAVLLVDALHFVDVLGHLLHALQRLRQVLVLACPSQSFPLASHRFFLLLREMGRQRTRRRIGEAAQLLQQQRVLEDALDRLDQVRLERRRVLLARIARLEKLLQGLRAFV